MHKSFAQGDYHWSLLQVEYATDLVFRSQETLAPLYEQLSRQAVLGVRPNDGHLSRQEDHRRRWRRRSATALPPASKGRCIKHHLGTVQVKMYDKYARVLRIETTVNDVSFFKHHRKVEHETDPARGNWRR